jgi:Lecithin:cholesterol acyltransferase
MADEDSVVVQRIPVLIIPGFMSSGLVCKKSSVDNSKFVDKRVWLNIAQIGFQSLHVGSAVVENEKKRQILLQRDRGLHDHDADEHPQHQHQDDDALHVEYEEAHRCKSAWLQHMALQDDMCTERAGNELRAIPGLEGVEFLSDDSMTRLGTYVFGPVTSALQKMGYIRGVDLDAAPYDWRLPPSLTEERDAYHTNTIARIEKMYRDNGHTPVALLCHSLGCKMGHYFLNFCLHTKGQEWIDTHIYAYMPVGGPHLGVSKALRASISGDKMALDAFLSDEEGLILGRSLGSGPWMMSTQLPGGAHGVVPPSAIPNAYCRKEGSLSISITSSITMSPLVQRRTSLPSRIRLCMAYGEEVLCTEFKRYADTMTFQESFCFAAPPTLNRVGNERLVIYMQEPGTRSAASKDKRTCINRIAACLCCPIKWILCCPCSLVVSILKTGCWAATYSASAVAGAVAGAGTSVATSRRMDPSRSLKKADSGCYGGQFTVQFTASADVDNPPVFQTRRHSQATVHVEWIPPPSMIDTTAVDIGSAIAVLPADSSNTNQKTTTTLHMKDPRNEHAVFEPVSGSALIRAEGIDTQLLPLLQSIRYAKDPLGDPRTKSSHDAPPVKKVIAIYGINRPTEVSGIYRRAPARVVLPTGSSKESTFVLDTKAKLAAPEVGHGQGSVAAKSYQVVGGIINETQHTPQVMNAGPGGKTITTRHASGDGTVPFWSLQHSRTWASPGTCDVEVYEIDGAEHREILADKRFHEILASCLLVKK